MPDIKILIVEDEAIEAMDIQQRLAGLGYSLTDIAHNGEEGIRKVEESRPDLILMDIMMPGKLDGIAAAEQIRSRFDIPIIFLTAYADESTLGRAKITAPYGYIVKPFQERELHITVGMALYRHKMETKLRESEKWLATTLRSIGDAVIATDEKSRITFMNPVAEILTGWNLEDAQGKGFSDVVTIVSKETRNPIENPVERVLREGAVVGLADHALLISRQDKETPVSDSAAPIRDENGDILGIILILSDVTEREKAEDELKRANTVLEAVNRELEAFIYSVSHDLRTPLRAITNFSKILIDEHAAQLDATGRDYLDRVNKGAEKMNTLIDALLHLSRISRQEIDCKEFDMSEKACSIVAALRAGNPARKVNVSIQDGVTASADPELIDIVLTNLLGNAWKFTSKQGQARISFGAVEQDDRIVYFVRDNGAGFDASLSGKLFTPFQRFHTADEFPGTGVGLATVKRIIDRHGGCIWAESEPEKGAVFYFTL